MRASTYKDLSPANSLSSPSTVKVAMLSMTLQISPEQAPGSLPTLKPPDKLQQTLSSLIQNSNKLFGLIDRLQELASSALEQHKSQLITQVLALRSMSEKKQGHFMRLLQLSEEFANKYLLDISAGIQQRSVLLDRLEKRLEDAEKLRGEAVDLQMLHESGIIATIQDIRGTGKQPLILQT